MYLEFLFFQVDFIDLLLIPVLYKSVLNFHNKLYQYRQYITSGHVTVGVRTYISNTIHILILLE